MTKNESSLLLYFETQAVDRGGLLESARMNGDDFAIAHRWNAMGFVRFGRIASRDVHAKNVATHDHWCVLSNEAWRIAQIERRARCERIMPTATKTQTLRYGVA